MIGGFVLRLLSADNYPATPKQRVILNVAAFRQHNMIAGGVVRVTSLDSDDSGSVSLSSTPVVVFSSILGPSFMWDQHGLLLILRQNVCKFSFTCLHKFLILINRRLIGIMIHTMVAIDILKVKEGARLGVDKLEANNIQRAAHISLSEVHSTQEAANTWMDNSEQVSTRRKPHEMKEEGDMEWLKMLLRESLGTYLSYLSVIWSTDILKVVEMRYIWEGQAVKLNWEGISRTFLIRQGKAKLGNLEDRLQAMSLSNPVVPNSVWVVGWDCTIELFDTSQIRAGPAHSIVEKPILTSPYENVGGLSRQISQIRDLIEIPFTRPSLFSHFHLKPPKGLLLHGPPGTGKTHLARSIAQSTNSNFIVVNGPELGSAYHGESEKKLREVFENAQKSAPCIVVLDEVDAMCPRRDDGGDGGEVAKRVVATLLTILDGMEAQEDSKGRVVVVATTNRPNAIDPALRRPGRFDKEVEIGVYLFFISRYPILKYCLI
jgi:hypothetical protein